MRVIAGAYRGRRLTAPRGTDTRPTSDRVRESLFAILGPLDGMRVLDLFAGSGALGIEALSRGAAEAVFCDSSRAAVAAIRANLTALGTEQLVVRDDALRVLRTAHARHGAYDLVFLDPPYRYAERWAADLTAGVPPVLTADGRVVTESDRRAPLELGLPLLDERRYGDTLIRIHTHAP
jgi:16S rRNA (guanine(966)-N(2))-methyltransferase RsmD